MSRSLLFMVVLSSTLAFTQQASAVVVADARADYSLVAGGSTTNTVGGLAATGTGTWDYLRNSDGSDLTPASFPGPTWTYLPSNGNFYSINFNSDLGVNGYYGPGGTGPNAGEIWFHPGSVIGGIENGTVLRWTAGPGESGTIDISGYLQRPTVNSGPFAVDFGIWKSDAAETTFTQLGSTLTIVSPDTSDNPFSESTTISPGEKIFLALFSGVPGDTSGINSDSSILSAVIDLQAAATGTPEPSSLLLVALSVIGLAMVRRRTTV